LRFAAKAVRAAFAVDASLIAADANKQRSAAGSDDVYWEVRARTRRSVREYLDTLDEAQSLLDQACQKPR
jgi:chromosome condensin MukBEF complex kleisin-like MukF subunit